MKITTSIALAVFILASQTTSIFAGRGMDLTLSCDKNKYEKDEPISITLTLKNNGKAAVWINKRFFISSRETAADKRDGYLAVISPSGQPLDCKVTYDTGLPRTDHFILLEPGKEQSNERKQTINHFFDFTTAGKYKIIATYENVFGKEIGLDAVTERLDSKPVTIEILGKKQ